MIALTDRKVLLETPMDARPLDIFHAYAGPHTVCRRVNGRWDRSRIILDGEDIGEGEDPRITLFRNQPLVSAAIGHSQPYRTVMFHPLWEWAAIPGRYGNQHKNLVPFVYADKTGIVHTYDPPMLAREGFWIEGKSNRSEMHADSFSIYRGGTNGIEMKGEYGSYIFGIGHTTRKAGGIVHRPFAWRLDPETADMVIEDCEVESTRALIDPTSLEYVDGELICYTCETECEWHERKGVAQSVRYKVELDL